MGGPQELLRCRSASSLARAPRDGHSRPCRTVLLVGSLQGGARMRVAAAAQRVRRSTLALVLFLASGCTDEGPGSKPPGRPGDPSPVAATTLPAANIEFLP